MSRLSYEEPEDQRADRSQEETHRREKSGGQTISRSRCAIREVGQEEQEVGDRLVEGDRSVGTDDAREAGVGRSGRHFPGFGGYHSRPYVSFTLFYLS